LGRRRGYQAAGLVKAKRQAAKLKAELGTTWVTRVMCLHSEAATPFYDRFWIVPGNTSATGSESRRTRKFERLAKYADTL